MRTRIKAVFSVMTDMIAFRDDVTGGHIDRTCTYLELLVDKMARKGLYRHIINQWDMDLLLCSAPLHDVGKIAISEELLNKPGRLTASEFDVMKTHAAIGVRIIDRIDIDFTERSHTRYARTIAGTHHERWDGTGYPNGMYGSHIPLEGRLMAIADVYDALISDRPYKKAIPPPAAAAIIEEGAGTHFDPFLVDIFRDVAPQFEYVASKHADRHTDAHQLKAQCLEGSFLAS